MRLRTRIRLAFVVLGALLTFALVALASALVLPWAALRVVEHEARVLGVELSAARVQVHLRESEVVLDAVRVRAGGASIGHAARVVLAYDPIALALRRVHARDGALVLPGLLHHLAPLVAAPPGRLSAVRLERMALGEPGSDPAPVLDALAVSGLEGLTRGREARLEAHLALGPGRAGLEGTLAAVAPAGDGAGGGAPEARGYRLEGELNGQSLPAAGLRPLLARWGLRDAHGPVEIAPSRAVARVRLERAQSTFSLTVELHGRAPALSATLAGGTRLRGRLEWAGRLGIEGSTGAGGASAPQATYEGTVRGADLSLAGSDAQAALAGGAASASWRGEAMLWPTWRLDGYLAAPVLHLALSRDGAALAVHLTNASLHAKGTPLADEGLAASTLAVDEARVVGERGSVRLEGVEGGQLFAGLDGEVALSEMRARQAEVVAHTEPAPWLRATGLVVRELELRAGEVRAASLGAEHARYRGSNLGAEAERIEARSIVLSPGARASAQEVTLDEPRLQLVLTPDGAWHGPVDLPGLSIADLHTGHPGRLVLEDRRFAPPLRTEATGLTGRVTGLGAGADAALTVSAVLSGGGIVRGRGTFGLVPALHAQGELSVTGLDLARLTPYAERYADTLVRGGRGDLEVRATLADGRVEGSVEAVLQRPLLAPADAEEPGRGEALRASLALLRGASGAVRVQVPFGGPVSGPELDLDKVLELAVHRAGEGAATLAFPSLELVRAVPGQPRARPRGSETEDP